MQMSDSTGAIYRPIPFELVVRNALLNALAFTDGDQAKAARFLEVSSRRMAYMMGSHGIPVAREGRVLSRGASARSPVMKRKQKRPALHLAC